MKITVDKANNFELTSEDTHDYFVLGHFTRMCHQGQYAVLKTNDESLKVRISPIAFLSSLTQLKEELLGLERPVKKASSKQPLKCDMKDSVLIVSIGIDTLAALSMQKNGGPVNQKEEVIADEALWAKEVAKELFEQARCGESLISKALDTALRAAYENDGSLAVKLK